MTNLVLLTLGATLLAGLFVSLGVHAYSAGLAQRAALIDRLSAEGAPGPPAAGAASRASTGACAGRGWAGASN